MRFFFVFFVFLLGVNALNFEPCYQKNSSAIFKIDGFDAIGVSEDLAIVSTDLFPRTLKDAQILKTNTHLKLLLVKTKNIHDYIKMVPISRAENKQIAVILKDTYKVGNLVSKQMAFDLARLDISVPKASVVGIKCYSAIGIGMGDNKFLQSKYIWHFIDTTPFVYSDLGIRFFSKKPSVSISNPYLYPQIKMGDIIISLNGKKIENIADFEESVILSKPGEIFTIELQRADKILKFNLKLKPLISDSYDTETFLESFGLFFNKDLVITRVKEGSIAFERKLLAGDKLVGIDKALVSTPREVATYLSQKPKEISSFLFQRGGFQFFVTFEDYLYKKNKKISSTSKL